jgi:hypothetical protein
MIKQKYILQANAIKDAVMQKKVLMAFFFSSMVIGFLNFFGALMAVFTLWSLPAYSLAFQLIDIITLVWVIFLAQLIMKNVPRQV